MKLIVFVYTIENFTLKSLSMVGRWCFFSTQPTINCLERFAVLHYVDNFLTIWVIELFAYTVPCLQEDTLNEFLKEIDASSPESAILKIVEPFASARIVDDIGQVPISLLLLYNESFESYSLEAPTFWKTPMSLLNNLWKWKVHV